MAMLREYWDVCVKHWVKLCGKKLFPGASSHSGHFLAAT